VACEFEVRAKLLFARMNALIQKCPNAKVVEQMKKEITALEKKYAAIDDPEIKSIIYHSWINYYRVLVPNWKKRATYLQKIEDMYKNSKLPIFERAISECHKAEMLYERSEFSNAYLAYAKTFSMYMPLLRNQFHHFARWIELSLILGLYADTEHLLDTLFKVYVKNRHESNGVLGSILYTQLYILKGDYELAFQYLSLAKSLNSLQIYFSYEIRIRMLETLIFSFSGDHDFVEKLVKRSIRYVQLQKLAPKRYKFIQFLRILKDFKNIKPLYPHDLNSKTKLLLAEFDFGYEKLNGLLLKKLISKAP
jgi:hypothetical protein